MCQSGTLYSLQSERSFLYLIFNWWVSTNSWVFACKGFAFISDLWTVWDWDSVKTFGTLGGAGVAPLLS